MLGIVAVGVVRESRNFRAPRAHRAVIFVTAQLSNLFSHLIIMLVYLKFCMLQLSGRPCVGLRVVYIGPTAWRAAQGVGD